MDNLSQTIDLMVDRLDVTRCAHCGCEIDVSDLTLFDQIICPECDLQGTVPCKLGQYLMQDRIGSGAMGTVYQALDEFLERTVAIKVLRKKLGEDKKAVEKFKQEAVAIAALNHPNIAQVYAFGEQNGQPYIVMEYLPGDTLKDMMSNRGPLNQAFVMKVGADISRALEAASEVRIVHGDVKPENITFDDKGTAKLVDFGIATFEYGAQQKGIFGTPYYIAPEKVRHEKSDTRADQYSLGATLFHALTGRPPFIDKSNSPSECAKMRLRTKAPPISRYRRDINPDVQRIVSRMMEMEPARRYPNYTSLIGDMSRAVKTLGGLPQPTERKTKTVAPGPRSKTKTISRSRTSSISTPATGASSRKQSISSQTAATGEYKRSPVPAIVAVSVIAFGITVLVIRNAIIESQNERLRQERLAYARTALAQISDKADFANSRIIKCKGRIIQDIERIAEYGDKASTTGILDSEFMRKIKPYIDAVAKANSLIPIIESKIKDTEEKSARFNDQIANATQPESASITLAEMEKLLAGFKEYEAKVEEIYQKARRANITRANLLKQYEKESPDKDKKPAISSRDIRETELNRRRSVADLRKKEVEDLLKLNDQINILIRKNQFGEAAKTLKKHSFQTSAIQQKLQEMSDKAQRLVDLQDWLIVQLASSPIRGGWIHAGKRHDIAGADGSGIRAGLSLVSWDKIAPIKILGFLNHYFSRAGINKKTKAELCVATALYCKETDIQKGIELYSRKAIEYDPSMQKDIDRLLKEELLSSDPPAKAAVSFTGSELQINSTICQPMESLINGPILQENLQQHKGLIMKEGEMLEMSIPLANGLYEVFFSVPDDRIVITVELEQEKTAGGAWCIAPDRKGAIGPFLTTCRDGLLDLGIVREDGQLHLNGILAQPLDPEWSAKGASKAEAELEGKDINEGLLYKCYKGVWEWMPDVQELNTADEGFIGRFRLSHLREFDEHYCVVFNGYLDIAVGGKYKLYLSSDDGSQMFIDGKCLLDNNGIHEASEQFTTVNLAKGKHAIKAYYFQEKGNQSFSVDWEGSSNPYRDYIPRESLCHIKE